jgi:hypothetical protein
MEDASMSAGNEREWRKLRIGRITSSRFGDLMKSGRKKDDLWSAAGLSYLDSLICERLGGQLPEITGVALDWGNKNEARALEEYTTRVEHTVTPNPFTYFSYTPDIGGTPDAFASTDGCVECKCPYNGARHIRTLRTGTVPDEYIWQVHGHMLVADKQWCDFISYDPRLKNPQARLAIVTVERDSKKLTELTGKLHAAVEYIEETIQAIGGAMEQSDW